MTKRATAFALDEMTPLDVDLEAALLAVPDDEDDTDYDPLDVDLERALIEAAPPMVVGVDLRSNPAFTAELAARAASGASLIEQRPKKRRQRKLDFSFGPVWAPSGAMTTITVRPQCIYRGEKLMATDSASQAGMGTSIVQVAVGQKIQRPGNGQQGTLTLFYGQTALADGITYDTAHGYEAIAIQVYFIQACTFYADLFGTAELDE